MVLEFSTPTSAGKQRRAAASAGAGPLGSPAAASAAAAAATTAAKGSALKSQGVGPRSPAFASPVRGLRRGFGPEHSPALDTPSSARPLSSVEGDRGVEEVRALTPLADSSGEDKLGLLGSVRKTLSVVSGGWISGESGASLRGQRQRGRAGDEAEASLPSASELEGLAGLQAAEKAIEVCLIVAEEHHRRGSGTLEGSVPGVDFGHKLASALEQPGPGEASGQKMQLVQRIRQINDEIVQRGSMEWGGDGHASSVGIAEHLQQKLKRHNAFILAIASLRDVDISGATMDIQTDSEKLYAASALRLLQNNYGGTSKGHMIEKLIAKASNLRGYASASKFYGEELRNIAKVLDAITWHIDSLQQSSHTGEELLEECVTLCEIVSALIRSAESRRQALPQFSNECLGFTTDPHPDWLCGDQVIYALEKIVSLTVRLEEAFRSNSSKWESIEELLETSGMLLLSVYKRSMSQSVGKPATLEIKRIAYYNAKDLIFGSSRTNTGLVGLYCRRQANGQGSRESLERLISSCREYYAYPALLELLEMHDMKLDLFDTMKSLKGSSVSGEEAFSVFVFRVWHERGSLAEILDPDLPVSLREEAAAYFQTFPEITWQLHVAADRWNEAALELKRVAIQMNEPTKGIGAVLDTQARYLCMAKMAAKAGQCQPELMIEIDRCLEIVDAYSFVEKHRVMHSTDSTQPAGHAFAALSSELKLRELVKTLLSMGVKHCTVWAIRVIIAGGEAFIRDNQLLLKETWKSIVSEDNWEELGAIDGGDDFLHNALTQTAIYQGALMSYHSRLGKSCASALPSDRDQMAEICAYLGNRVMADVAAKAFAMGSTGVTTAAQ